MSIESYTPCPHCHGKHGLDCETCSGLGHVDPDQVDEEEGEGGPDWLIEGAEFLRLWSLIERHGPGGTLDLLTHDGERPEFHPVFADELLPLFQAELDRLVHAEQIRRLKRSKR